MAIDWSKVLKISEISDMMSTPLLHQKKLAIDPESLFSSIFRYQCVEKRSLFFESENTSQPPPHRKRIGCVKHQTHPSHQ